MSLYKKDLDIILKYPLWWLSKTGATLRFTLMLFYKVHFDDILNILNGHFDDIDDHFDDFLSGL